MNTRWQFKIISYGYEPSVTDASEPNEQMYQKNIRPQLLASEEGLFICETAVIATSVTELQTAHVLVFQYFAYCITEGMT